MSWGITGGDGFIGRNLRHHADFLPLPRADWDDTNAMLRWSRACDVIVHLAGMSRSDDGGKLYQTNLELCSKLSHVIKPGQLIIFGSTTHIEKNTPYHASKRDGAKLLAAAAKDKGAKFVDLLMSNTFGPGGKPFFNSVIATFCYQAAHGEKLRIDNPDTLLALVHIDNLCRKIIGVCQNKPEGRITIEAEFHPSLGETAALLTTFAAGKLPDGNNRFARLLFECYQFCCEN